MVCRSRLFACALVVLVLALAAPPAAAADRAGREVGDVIPGSYIVTVRDGVAPRAVAAGYERSPGVRTRRTFTRALRGFSVRADRAAVARLRADAHVRSVEPDRVVGVSAASWGLDRIDQRALPLDGVYRADGDGSGVTVYVVDTGIRPHDDLAGRVAPGATAVPDGRGTDDCDGHGTHVAGTIGGTDHGVAPGVTLVPVRVLDCDGLGSLSGVIAGVDWVTHNATAPAVMNVSLGSEPSWALDTAVRSAVAAGITVAVAAGNASADACDTSPARVPGAITVGATDWTDARAWFSNRGACLDVFAPGVAITSTGIASPTSTTTLSGTSMASPHVAGVAALHLAADPSASPAMVGAAIAAEATTDAVTSAGSGSPDRLLHAALPAEAPDPESGSEPEPDLEPAPEPEPAPAPQPEPDNAAPVARATASCRRDVCTFDASGSYDADGAVVSHRWTFPDGTTVDGSTVTVRLAGGGTIAATATVTDDDGATATATTSVHCRDRRRYVTCW